MLHRHSSFRWRNWHRGSNQRRRSVVSPARAGAPAGRLAPPPQLGRPDVGRIDAHPGGDDGGRGHYHRGPDRARPLASPTSQPNDAGRRGRRAPPPARAQSVVAPRELCAGSPRRSGSPQARRLRSPRILIYHSGWHSRVIQASWAARRPRAAPNSSRRERGPGQIRPRGPGRGCYRGRLLLLTPPRVVTGRDFDPETPGRSVTPPPVANEKLSIPEARAAWRPRNPRLRGSRVRPASPVTRTRTRRRHPRGSRPRRSRPWRRSAGRTRTARSLIR